MSLLDGYIYNIVARVGNAADVPTLLPGEIGYDVDTKTFRVGDDTPVPPRIMTTKSTGSFDFSSVTSVTLPGNVVVSGGKVDGVRLATMNANNGLLARISDGVYINTSVTSGDGSLLVSNPTGVNGSVDIRISPTYSSIQPGDKGDITVSSDGLVWTINAGVVGTNKLAANAVTTAKIADGNVTTAKLAAASVGTVQLIDGAVTAAKITDGNVTTAKLADGAVTAAKITDGGVTSSKVAVHAVSNGQLATMLAKRVKGAVTAGDVVDLTMADLVALLDDYFGGTGWRSITGLSDGSVTNVKLADMPAFTYKMRNNASAGVPQDVTASSLAADTSPATTKIIITHDPSTGAPTKTPLANLPPPSVDLTPGAIGSYTSIGENNSTFSLTPYTFGSTKSGADLNGYFGAPSAPNYTGLWACRGSSVITTTSAAMVDAALVNTTYYHRSSLWQRIS